MWVYEKLHISFSVSSQFDIDVTKIEAFFLIDGNKN